MRLALTSLFGQRFSHALHPRIVSSSYSIYQKSCGQSNLLYPRQPHLLSPIPSRANLSTQKAYGTNLEASESLKADPAPSSVEDLEEDSDLDALEENNDPKFWRPLFFATSLSLGIFYAAAYASRSEIEDLENEAQKGSSPTSSNRDLAQQGRDERLALVKRERCVESVRRMDEWLCKCGLPPALRQAVVKARLGWYDMLLTQKICVPLIAMNFAVFAMWQVPKSRIRTFMVQHFRHYTLSGRSLTLLTAVFSHRVNIL